MTEKDIERILMDIILDNAEETELEGCEICTYEEDTICTMDKGLVIDLPNGSSIYLTIRGYTPDGRMG